MNLGSRPALCCYRHCEDRKSASEARSMSWGGGAACAGPHISSEAVVDTGTRAVAGLSEPREGGGRPSHEAHVTFLTYPIK